VTLKLNGLWVGFGLLISNMSYKYDYYFSIIYGIIINLMYYNPSYCFQLIIIIILNFYYKANYTMTK